ncbi:hypothetical protein [Archangium lipolyticum]|uniref:hypothetical protein n=1 Tax=Archangium lipolyticum TaxID=2970465 RepID=UPI00214A8A18|nr:hypothetical protein [Archangium lipolyticum]
MDLRPDRCSSRGYWPGWGLLAVLLLAGTTGCSLVLDSGAAQCATDEDCVRFGSYPICQEGLCVPSGLGPPGCFRGEPSSEEQYRNQCTLAQCVPFDNCARLGLCDGASLPPLVPKP